MLNQVEVGYKYKLIKLTLRLVQLHGSTHKVTCKYSSHLNLIIITSGLKSVQTVSFDGWCHWLLELMDCILLDI